ncbi:hypothetical protein HF086_011012 [Spodoptera exigua]|uniref:Uncharacterized protein n=1 Tax=Spodoptera exigua TaxID=7107 RepID=A0A922MS91_SPOEX|nr:hypothetical protein HF086_011012 [Spodoptera exigua]
MSNWIYDRCPELGRRAWKPTYKSSGETELNRPLNEFKSDKDVTPSYGHVEVIASVRQIFQLEDSQERQLSTMLEYMTFYGNKFLGMSAAGEHYTLSFNATGATIMNLGSSPQTQAENVWSSGFAAVNFTRLKELDLRACSIQVLGQNLFTGMTELRALYIGENEIFFIDSTAFTGLTN